MIDMMWLGLKVALSWQNLAYCFLGVFLGTFTGVLPGIGPLTAITLLLPITYYVDPASSLIMLAGIYYGAQYGGSTTAILVNLPGEASSAVTAIDGYQMARKGRAGVALFMSAYASFIGGTIGIILLMFLTPAIVAVTFAFSPAEYFALMLCALLAAATITQDAPVKGLSMVIVGLLLGGVGVDPNSGAMRFALGRIELFDGIGLIPIAMGLFGISEIIASAGAQTADAVVKKVRLRDTMPTRDDLRVATKPILRGSAIGSLFGALPGTGATIAAFVAYAIEKRVAKEPQRFGQGALEGVAAPEAANNAAAQAAFIPTLAIGIPGSVVMAIMLGALLIHNIQPGPRFIIEHPDIYWGLVMSFWVGNIMLLVLNIPMIGVWVKLVQVPYKYLFPTILALLCVGVYSIGENLFDVGLVTFFGIVGYAMRLYNYHPAPILIGYVLGPMMEENLRRALIITQGDVMAVISRPVTAVLLLIALALLIYTAWSMIMRRPQPETA